MSTIFQPSVHHSFGPPLAVLGNRRPSGFMDNGNNGNGLNDDSVSSSPGSKRSSSGKPPQLAEVVEFLKSQNSEEMDAILSSRLMNATHPMLLDWIHSERLSKLPPEGSSYDSILAWALLFVERLHTFELAVEGFAGDSHQAAQLAYGHCALLLEVHCMAYEFNFKSPCLTYMTLAGRRKRLRSHGSVQLPGCLLHGFGKLAG